MSEPDANEIEVVIYHDGLVGLRRNNGGGSYHLIVLGPRESAEIIEAMWPHP
jgi:hypothetical protein